MRPLRCWPIPRSGRISTEGEASLERGDHLADGVPHAEVPVRPLGVFYRVIGDDRRKMRRTQSPTTMIAMGARTVTRQSQNRSLAAAVQ
jgi:hypothetical protein